MKLVKFHDLFLDIPYWSSEQNKIIFIAKIIMHGTRSVAIGIDSYATFEGNIFEADKNQIEKELKRIEKEIGKLNIQKHSCHNSLQYCDE